LTVPCVSYYDTAPPEFYTLSLHDALPISVAPVRVDGEIMEPRVSVPIAKGSNPATVAAADPALDPLLPCAMFHGLRVNPPNQILDRKSTRLNSSHVTISYAVFCLKKKTKT